MKNLKIVYSVILLFSFMGIFAQAPDIEWQETFGGSFYDGAFDMISTPDGGYLICGYTESDDGDVTFTQGGGDIWILKMNASGTIEWQNAFGGSLYDFAAKIIPATDGGYILAGATESNNGDVSANYGNIDVWVVKFDATGALLWEKNYGGTGFDTARDIIATEDGGYLIISDTDSVTNDVSVSYGGADFWVIKINATGTMEWEKSYGGSDHEIPYGIIENSIGNFVIAGYTFSNDGDVTHNNGGRDIWVIEITPTGTLVWQNTFGGSVEDSGKTIQLTQDGGYLVAGITSSTDGDVSYNAGLGDAWILNIDATGNLVSEKTYGGSLSESFETILAHPEGGFIAVGDSRSSDGDVSSNYGGEDVWVVRIDDSSEIIWEKNLGGTNNDFGLSVLINPDGTYFISGSTRSVDGDVTSNNGNYDAWVIKLAADLLSISDFEKTSISVYPNPAIDKFTITSSETIESVKIYDVLGKEVLQQQATKHSETIQINHLQKGAYFVKINTAKGAQTHKLIKK